MIDRLAKAAVLAAMIGGGAMAAETDLTVERLEASPALSGPNVQGLKFSPDGKRLTFLRGSADEAARLDLWEYDLESGEASLLVDSAAMLDGAEEVLSEAEKARRERDRSLTGKSGIVSYDWNAAGDALLIPLGGDLYVLPVGGKARQLTATDAFEGDARFSPDGKYVSFVRDRDLYVVDVESGAETRLTTAESDTISNGMAEFAAAEELGRYSGYWWSPDSKTIAFARVDEAPVMVLQRYEVNDDGGVTSIEQRYPKAGTPNAEVSLGLAPIDGGATLWVNMGKDKDIYLARVNWAPDSKTLLVQRLSRDQETLDILRASAATGITDTLMSEKSDVWVNLTDDLTFLPDGRFVWTSERTGFRHVYLSNGVNGDLKQLTSGDWVVDSVLKVDADAGLVYFAGWMESPLEQHLYSVPLAGGQVRQVTLEEGWHDPVVGAGVFIDKFSSPDQPPQVMVRDLKEGTTRFAVIENKLDDSHPYAAFAANRARTEFGSFEVAGGTELHYRLYLPADFDASRQYPLILNPYGGPHGQRVKKSWSLDFNEILARRGYVVMVIDNRGMWNRGLKFEAAIKNAMGTVEIADQVAGVEHLVKEGYIDRERVGFWGWSYGGYMTLMALSQAPDVFKAGMAVAPVTDWRLYDTAYTERYLGMPDAPGDVYEKSSVFAHLGGLKGKLLLIHGMADDNVFFDNSVRLMGVLQTNIVPFELMTYPGKRHGIQGEAVRAHLWGRGLDFFERNLK
ncbi:S9 family peptidase [Gimibacter soli]|uniref:S9 family peptidase n=1 Tax=Gimibacter soli TaxID=3024400 RepID=A0AAE9XRP8_9PROT|nr:S9 family peptidase [Gimibacter soli]WCL52700.1 S9 family peptidase [Gimibacter soli]